jgi:hypothetical protein
LGVSPLDTATFIRRIDELLGAQLPTDNPRNIYAAVVEEYQGTLALLISLYGTSSHQEETLLSSAKRASNLAGGLIEHNFPHQVRPVIKGTLRAIRADLEAGLIGNVAQRAAGEVLGDMLGLAKEAMALSTESAKNVAAVLTAAAYEDTIRQMGTTLANVRGRPDLSAVITALKDAGVLVGAALTTGQSYLKFRNDALHADWANVDRAVVGSCMAFVEALLLKHFS